MHIFETFKQEFCHFLAIMYRRYSMFSETNNLFIFLFGRNRGLATCLYNALSGLESDEVFYEYQDDCLFLYSKDNPSYLICNTRHIYDDQYLPENNVFLKICDRVIEFTKIHREDMIPIPIIFYEGEEYMEEDFYIYLSDYLDTNGSLEARIRIINIMRSDSLHKKCRPLYEYSWFIRNCRRVRVSTPETDKTVEETLKLMPDDFILKELFVAQKNSIVDILHRSDEKEILRSEGEKRCYKNIENKMLKTGFDRQQINEILYN